MDTTKPVELVRVPRGEAVYEREAIFGRDSSSVFPSEAQKAKAQAADELRKAVGLDNSKFITESELSDLKKSSGGMVENGAVSRDKTLAVILAENKAQKEEAFQEVWRTMKQGKNRPLDEDDLAFVNSLVDSENAKLRTIAEAERADIDAFQEAVRRAAEQQQVSAAAREQGSRSQEEESHQQKPRHPLVKIRHRAGPAKRIGAATPSGEAMKRQRTDEDTKPPDGGNDSALAGLIGGYASDSD